MTDLDAILTVLSYDPKTGIFRWIRNRPGVRAGGVAGCVKRDGYRYITVLGRRWNAANLAWFMHFGTVPTFLLDHRNRNRSDDRIRNLRPASVADNAANGRCHKDNTSGIRGVFWDARLRKWRAAITRYGKREHLGVFTNKRSAKSAYRKRAKELAGTFAGGQ